jgi:hypothetical protein
MASQSLDLKETQFRKLYLNFGGNGNDERTYF